jgi:uncharacterized membrane protein
VNVPLVTLARWGLAGLMIIAGIAHQVFTEEFLAQVPSWLPARSALVVVSGVVEIALGVALIAWASRRRQVGLALAAYLAVVFVGNVSQAIEGTSLFALDTDVERYGRLALQPILIAWALWCTGAWPLRRDGGDAQS